MFKVPPSKCATATSAPRPPRIVAADREKPGRDHGDPVARDASEQVVVENDADRVQERHEPERVDRGVARHESRGDDVVLKRPERQVLEPPDLRSAEGEVAREDRTRGRHVTELIRQEGVRLRIDGACEKCQRDQGEQK